MLNQNRYVCQLATINDLNSFWEEEIKENPDNALYHMTKYQYINELKRKTRITYVGKINNEIISTATVIIEKNGLLNEAKSSKDLINSSRCFLCGVKTKKEYENKGYFSKLYKFIEKDIKKRGFKEISLSVDISITRNMIIYFHYNYINYIRTEVKKDKNNNTFYFNYYYKVIT